MQSPGRKSYEVLVPACRGSELAELTLHSLREQLARPEAVRVLEVPADGLDSWEMVLEQLAQNPGRDRLVVAPGILAAPLFDLRLQWSAYAAEGVAMVSPLCDLDPVSSLARHGVCGLTATEIDQRIAGGWLGPVVGAPYPLPECFFVRGELIRPLLEAEPPRDLREWIRRLRQEGLLCGLAPHIFVGSSGLIPRQSPWLNEGTVGVFLSETPLHRVAQRAAAVPEKAAVSVERRSRPRLLHISHSLGGGLERWVELFISAAPQVDNFVLKSIGEKGRLGSQLWLYEGSYPWQPLRTWKLTPPIDGSVVTHLDYQQALQEIVSELGIDAVVVSSLIGHSLDALRAAVPTAVVLHDYYPFCPALHIFFEGVCTECGQCRLAECLRRNPLNDLFDSRAAREWLVLREAFLRALAGTKVVAPSASVVRHFRQLAPQVAEVEVAVLPHGSDTRDLWREAEPRAETTGPLRVLVLGLVSSIKGEDLLRPVIERTSSSARFWLVGSGARGHAMAGKHVEVVIEHYDRQQLPEILARIAPDVALFLSVVPETFSFTLDECFAAGIPPIALRVGSFADRIEDGVNGFLCEPEAACVVARLERLAADRGAVARARQELRQRPARSAAEMVTDYARVLDLPDRSPRAYFSSAWGGVAENSGYHLPAGSPLGFAEFLRQVETGTLYHIRQTRRLRSWQQAVVLRTAMTGFRAARFLLRWLVR